MAKEPREGPKRITPTARRRKLLDAAAGLFRKKGYLAVTLDQVAAAAHVTPEALAKHFPSKSELLATLYQDFHAAAFAPPGDEPPDPVARLVGLPDRFHKAAKAHAGAMAAVVEVLTQQSEDLPGVAAGLRSSETAIAELIRAGQAAGVVRRTLDPPTAARDWLRYLFGMELLRPMDDDHPTPDADLLIHGLIKTDV